MGIKTLTAVVLTAFLLTACSEPTVNQGNVSNASGNAAPTAPATNQPVAEAPTWGKRYTWTSGLAVEISAPKGCKPGEFAIGAEKAERAVKFTVLVINGTDKPVEAGVLTLGGDVQFNGVKSETIYDSQGECGLSDASGTVLPGKTLTYSIAFAVGAQPGELQMVLQPTIGGDKAVYVGKA